jgi:hypothetical protein
MRQNLDHSQPLPVMETWTNFLNTKEELHFAKAEIMRFLGTRHLQLKESATLLRPTWQGLPFLGFRVFPGMLKIKRDNWRRFTRKFRLRQRQFARGEISANAFTTSIASLVGHIRHGDSWRLLEKFLDKFGMDL